MKSPKWQGMYVIPGGHVELGETLEQALWREVKEETGLEIFAMRLLIVQDFIYGPLYHQRKHFIFLDYVCRTNSRKVSLNNEGTDYVWVTRAESQKLNVEPYTRRVIDKYYNEKK